MSNSRKHHWRTLNSCLDKKLELHSLQNQGGKEGGLNKDESLSNLQVLSHRHTIHAYAHTELLETI